MVAIARRLSDDRCPARCAGHDRPGTRSEPGTEDYLSFYLGCHRSDPGLADCLAIDQSHRVYGRQPGDEPRRQRLRLPVGPANDVGNYGRWESLPHSHFGNPDFDYRRVVTLDVADDCLQG